MGLIENKMKKKAIIISIKGYKLSVKEKLRERRGLGKTKINKIYSDFLPKEIQFESKFNDWRFNIFVDNKDIIIKKLFENKLFGSSHYSSVSHLFGGNSSINAKTIHAKIINLFNDYRFNEEMALKASNIVTKNIIL